MKKNKFLNVVMCFLIAVVIYFILVVITNSNSYQEKVLNSNTNSMFTITDLTINNSKYNDILNSVVTEFGSPKGIQEFTDNDNKYKEYTYDGLKLTFKEVNNEYILMKVKVSSDRYNVSRSIKVGDSVNSVMNKFLIINTKGSYLYGNYTENDINGKKVKENVYFGKRDKNIVYYLYMDAPYNNGFASYKDDIATLTFKVSANKIKEIEWMYGNLD